MKFLLVLTLSILLPVSIPEALAQDVESRTHNVHTEVPRRAGQPAEAEEGDSRAGAMIHARTDMDPGAPRDRPRVTAHQLLRGRPAATSFDELQAFLLPGYEVVVWDTSGHKMRGRVSEISTERIVVFREPFVMKYVRRPQQDIVNRESITRIDVVDPTTEGTLIGAAVGAGLMVGFVQAGRDHLHGELAPVAYALLGVVAFVPSMGLGSLVDWLHNSPVYERQPHTRRLALAPWFGRHELGASVQVRY